MTGSFRHPGQQPSPAKAGAQSRCRWFDGTALDNLDLYNWAPAFAGEEDVS